MSEPYILVVFASETGSTKNLAHSISRGVNACSGIEARVRTVPSVNELIDEVDPQDVPYASIEDLENCCGLAIGSPTHFGNMASGLQYWIEKTSSLWFSGRLVNKPVSVFTSSASLHGGQETTLMNMLTPLMHQGLVIVGVPYTSKSLLRTKKGGTPYGASHVAGEGGGDAELTEDEHKIAVDQGKRLAQIALALKALEA